MAIREQLDRFGSNLRDMIKKNGHTKHYRYQSTALIKICRELWKYFDHGHGQFEQLNEFITAANNALDLIRDEEVNAALVTERLELIKNNLRSYMKLVPGQENSDFIIKIFEDAQEEDAKRSHKMLSLKSAKQVITKKKKMKIDFTFHNGTDGTAIVPHELSENSTIEEVIFKFSRPHVPFRISLLDNAYIYTDLKHPYSSIQNFDIGPDGKKPINCLKTFLTMRTKNNIHIAADKNPRIHVMCTTKTWTLLFSLAFRLQISSGSVVLKGIDGTLYNGQEIAKKLIRQEALFKGDWKYGPVSQGPDISQTVYSFRYSDWPRGLRQLQERLLPQKNSNWLITPPEESMNEELTELKRHVSQSMYPRPSTLRPATPVASAAGANAGQTSASTSRGPSPAVNASGSLVIAERTDNPARTGSPARTKVQEIAQNIDKNQKMPDKKASWRSFWRSKE